MHDWLKRIGGFWLWVELHREGSATNKATPSSLDVLTFTVFKVVLYECPHYEKMPKTHDVLK